MILIKSAQIIDGTGKPPFKADILIKGDKIAAIGNFPRRKADAIIDGLGFSVMPGFIDVNANSDHYLSLFNNPLQKDYLLQGVTTIIGGHCGSSLAPLIEGTLKSIRKWGDFTKMNVDWHSVSELKKVLKRLKIGVNFGTFAGYFTIRRDIAGEEIGDLTDSELDIFKNILKKALKDGALGLSTGLGYVLSRWISYSEIKKILKIAADQKRIYATHLRNEKKNIVASMEETLKISEETGVPAIISHLRPIIGYEKYFKEAFSLMESRLNKVNIYFDASPFDFSIIPIYALLPDWAQQGNLEIMLDAIKEKNNRERILKELSGLKKNLKDMIIAKAKDNNSIVGRTLGEFSEGRGMDICEGLLFLMEITNMRTLIVEKNINMDILSEIIFHPRALIGSNSASFSDDSSILKLENSTNTFPRYFGLAAARNVPIEEIVRRVTSMPAKILNISKRGAVREGWFADLAMMKEGKVINVFVNGKMAVKDGKEINLLAGTPI